MYAGVTWRQRFGMWVELFIFIFFCARSGSAEWPLKKQSYLTSFCFSPFSVASDNDTDPYLLSLLTYSLFGTLTSLFS